MERPFPDIEKIEALFLGEFSNPNTPPLIIIIEPDHSVTLEIMDRVRLLERCKEDIAVIALDFFLRPPVSEDVLDELFAPRLENLQLVKLRDMGEDLAHKLLDKPCLEPEDEHSHSHLLNQQENMLRKTANRRGGTLRINCQQSQKRPSFRKYHNR